jgi:hypothetical protein
MPILCTFTVIYRDLFKEASVMFHNIGLFNYTHFLQLPNIRSLSVSYNSPAHYFVS